MQLQALQDVHLEGQHQQSAEQLRPASCTATISLLLECNANPSYEKLLVAVILLLPDYLGSAIDLMFAGSQGDCESERSRNRFALFRQMQGVDGVSNVGLSFQHQKA